jgi:uncharacterized damage-inducible protein DinB
VKRGELLEELTMEAASSRRLLERIPEERLAWRPHEKSMTLGQLGLHIALLPLGITELVAQLRSEVPTVPLDQPAGVGEILNALDRSIETAKAKISEWDDGALDEEWEMTREGKTLLRMKRGWVLRTILMNHTCHHRGQLSVYLRLLDVPLPSIYGPTADEAMF